VAGPAFVPSPTSEITWSVRRPPPRGVQALGWVIGIAFAAGGTALYLGVVEDASFATAAGVGLALGILIPLILRRGSIVRLHADGQLTYGFGAHPNLVLPLAAIRDMRWIEQGLLRGIGLDIDPQAVRFIHRKGVSYATMRQYRKATGLDLVLEFLTPEDLERLRELRSDPSEPA